MNYTLEQISEIFTKVLSNTNLSLKVELAQLPSIPIKTPHILQEDVNLDVSKLSTEERLNLAKDPNATVEILQNLARDENYYVRYEVARHPNATVEILQGLAQDKDYYVRYGVSQHPKATVEILQGLARDENSGVREEAMKNPNYKSKNLELTSAQYEALKTLLESSQDEVLKSVTL